MNSSFICDRPVSMLSMYASTVTASKRLTLYTCMTRAHILGGSEIGMFPSGVLGCILGRMTIALCTNRYDWLAITHTLHTFEILSRQKSYVRELLSQSMKEIARRSLAMEPSFDMYRVASTLICLVSRLIRAAAMDGCSIRWISGKTPTNTTQQARTCPEQARATVSKVTSQY